MTLPRPARLTETSGDATAERAAWHRGLIKKIYPVFKRSPPFGKYRTVCSKKLFVVVVVAVIVVASNQLPVFKISVDFFFVIF